MSQEYYSDTHCNKCHIYDSLEKLECEVISLDAPVIYNLVYRFACVDLSEKEAV